MATAIITAIGTERTIVVTEEMRSIAVVLEDRQIVVDEHGGPYTVITDGSQGPPGSTGPQGDKGDKGDPGVSGASYVHIQAVASDTWVIAHGLHRYPSVVTLDSAGDEVWGCNTYDSDVQITCTFSAPFSGTAFLN